MEISREKVLEIAEKSKLILSENEIEATRIEMGRVLDYMEILGQQEENNEMLSQDSDTLSENDAIIPENDVIIHENEPALDCRHFREDQPIPSFSRESMLANAAENDGVFVVVPKTVD